MSKEYAANQLLKGIFDDGSFTELNRLTEDCEVVTGYGCISGCPCYAFVQNTEINNGAMGKIQANKLMKLYDLAEKTGCPVIGVYDSNGGHLGEGLDAVEAYSKLIAKADRLSGVIPQIAVIKGVCGASSAIWALCSDIVIAAKDAQLFLDKSGNDDNGIDNGTAQIVADDINDAIEKAKQIVCALPSNNLSAAPIADVADGEKSNCGCVIGSIADAGSVIQLGKNEDDSAKTALARLGGLSVGMVAVNGTMSIRDCKKIASFIGLCDAYTIPIITFVDTDGFCGCNGSLKAAAALTKAYTDATTAKVAVINGKAYGSAFLTFAGSADEVIAVKGSIVSTIEPEAAMNIAYNDRILAGEDKAALLTEYMNSEASAEKAAENGFIGDIVTEDELSDKLRILLDMLMSKRVSTLDKKHAVTIM